MFWIFALGIVTLCVASRGFRKFTAVIGGIAVLGAIAAIVAAIHVDQVDAAKNAQATNDWNVHYASCDKPMHANDEGQAYIDCIVAVDKATSR